MDTRAPELHPSRRGFLAGAVALAGGVASVGCAGATTVAGQPTVAQRPPRTAASRDGDRRILLAALAMERRTIDAYAACIPLLDAADELWAKAFVAEESEHAGALGKLIKLDGFPTPPAYGELAIGHPRDGAQALTLLAALERDQVSSYLRWIPQLSEGTLRAGVAAILASDAQHLTALRGARGLPALTSPFVLGSGRAS